MSKRTGFTLVFILVCQFIFAQRILTREEYIKTYRDLAVREMLRTGVPASIKLAQGCHESNNGNSDLSRKSNNHFGIKCKSMWNGGKVYHDDDERNECFRAYRSPEESFIDHSNFLSANPRYSELFTLNITDYKGWARGLKKAGYATDPNYAHRIIRIIEENQLYVYDQMSDPRQLGRFTNTTIGTQGSLINPFQTGRVSSWNNLKTIVVRAGDSMEGIAQELNMKPWQIYRYNDYPQIRQPRENEILYLEPKYRKADKGNETHVIESGETMHYVAQRYGIKLKPLLRRNGLKKGEEPNPGTVILLR